MVCFKLEFFFLSTRAGRQASWLMKKRFLWLHLLTDSSSKDPCGVLSLKPRSVGSGLSNSSTWDKSISCWADPPSLTTISLWVSTRNNSGRQRTDEIKWRNVFFFQSITWRTSGFMMRDAARNSSLEPPFNTVKASNFGPHGNFGLVLASSVAFLVNYIPKMNRTDFANLKYFYNFHFLIFL